MCAWVAVAQKCTVEIQTALVQHHLLQALDKIKGPLRTVVYWGTSDPEALQVGTGQRKKACTWDFAMVSQLQ